MNASKNQLVWARCHLAGDASGIDCTVASASESGAASAQLNRLVSWKRCASASLLAAARTVLCMSSALPASSMPCNGQKTDLVARVGDKSRQPRVAPGCQSMSPGVGIYGAPQHERSEEHTSELQSLMRISYAVFCLKKKKDNKTIKKTRLSETTDK